MYYEDTVDNLRISSATGCNCGRESRKSSSSLLLTPLLAVKRYKGRVLESQKGLGSFRVHRRGRGRRVREGSVSLLIRETSVGVIQT